MVLRRLHYNFVNRKNIFRATVIHIVISYFACSCGVRGDQRYLKSYILNWIDLVLFAFRHNSGKGTTPPAYSRSVILYFGLIRHFWVPTSDVHYLVSRIVEYCRRKDIALVVTTYYFERFCCQNMRKNKGKQTKTNFKMRKLNKVTFTKRYCDLLAILKTIWWRN